MAVVLEMSNKQTQIGSEIAYEQAQLYEQTLIGNNPGCMTIASGRLFFRL